MTVETTLRSVPEDIAMRNNFREAIRAYLADNPVTPPPNLDQLRDIAIKCVDDIDINYIKWLMISINNEIWRETVQAVPFEKRLLLLPQCLRNHEKCPAEIDEMGLLCEECGACCIGGLLAEAEELGYSVLVAEGAGLISTIIKESDIEAVVGVGCLETLERLYKPVESAAIPAIAIPLNGAGCVNTKFDTDILENVLHKYIPGERIIDLALLKDVVRQWFVETIPELEAANSTAKLAEQALLEGGKRWRPVLTAATYCALTNTSPENIPEIVRTSAIGVEAFHKASLIHDDIEDDDDKRYNTPCLHVTHGVPIAINIGDFLVGEGYRLLAQSGNGKIMTVAADGHRSLATGQGEELLHVNRFKNLYKDDIIQIFEQKTSPAFEVALKVGALLADCDDATEECLTNFSRNLGIAYQIQDDLDDWDQPDQQENNSPSLIKAIMSDGNTEGYALEQVNRLLDEYYRNALHSLQILNNKQLKVFLHRLLGKMITRHGAGSSE